MSGNILLHLTNKWMLTAILYVLSCHSYKEKPVVADHEAAKPGKQGSLTGRDEKDAFSAVSASSFCRSNAKKMHLKHNFPSTSTKTRSQNVVLLISFLVHQEKGIMVLPYFFFHRAARKWQICSWKGRLGWYCPSFLEHFQVTVNSLIILWINDSRLIKFQQVGTSYVDWPCETGSSPAGIIIPEICILLWVYFLFKNCLNKSKHFHRETKIIKRFFKASWFSLWR